MTVWIIKTLLRRNKHGAGKPPRVFVSVTSYGKAFFTHGLLNRAQDLTLF